MYDLSTHFHIHLGTDVVDAAVPMGYQGRLFRCRSILLYWTGDYPAQAAVSGTHSKTCHWCKLKSKAAPEISRRVWGDYRTYLPAGHPLRQASAQFGPVENRPPMEARTHEEYIRDGKANERHSVLLQDPEARKKKIYKKDYPYKKTGTTTEMSTRLHYCRHSRMPVDIT